MLRLLVLLTFLTACSPGERHEVILEVTNERDEPLVVRIIPEVLAGQAFPGRRDTGFGDGYEVAPGRQITFPLVVDSDRWTVTVNGAPVIRSSDPDVGQSRTRARLVVRRETQLLEVSE